MATTATDILSVSELKVHLFLPASDTGQDTALETLIKSAVAHVEHRADLTLVDKTVTEEFTPESDGGIYELYSDGVRLGAANADNTADAMITYASAQHVRTSAVCVLSRRGARGANIAPPAGGGDLWPETALGDYGNPTPLSVALTLEGFYRTVTDDQGMSTRVDDTPEDIKAAVILAAKDAYDGNPRDAISARSAVSALVAPHRRRA